jgi:predicted ABC-type ATPase
VNADRLARLEYPEATKARSYEAGLLAEKQHNTLLLSGAKFCLETGYKNPSENDFYSRPKGLGYAVIMVVINLGQSKLNAARVAEQVHEGRHKVSTEKLLQ